MKTKKQEQLEKLNLLKKIRKISTYVSYLSIIIVVLSCNLYVWSDIERQTINKFILSVLTIFIVSVCVSIVTIIEENNIED